MKTSKDNVGTPSPHNPFSTAATRPGAIPFRFPEGMGAASLVDELRRQHWWGEIVGPHGSGKSTLIETLHPFLEQAGREITRVTLHRGEKRLPITHTAQRAWSASTQVIIDGYEQLGHWHRLALKRACRKYQTGLLITAHPPMGLPRLYQTTTTLALAEELVAELTATGNVPHSKEVSISKKEVRDAYARHEGNLRETLFDLYDLYELRERGKKDDSP